MSDNQESEAISARIQILQENLSEAIRLAEVFHSGQVEAQRAAQQAIKEKSELEQQIQTLLNEKSETAEPADKIDISPLLAERDNLRVRVHDIESNLAEANKLQETRLKEIHDLQDRIDHLLAEKTEIERLKQALWDEKLLVQNDLSTLQTQMASERHALQDKIQALEIDLNTAGNRAEALQREKRAVEERVETIADEKIAVENKIQDALTGKIDAEIQLAAAVKDNETLTVQLEDCKKQLHRPIFKIAIGIVVILALALLAYSFLLFRGYPARLVNVDRQLEALVTRFEDRTRIFDTISQGQKQMASRIEEIYREVDMISKKAGISMIAAASGDSHVETGVSGLTDRLDRLEKALNELPAGQTAWQNEMDALRMKVADLEKQRKQLEIERARSLLPEDRHFKILTEVYFESGETNISEKAVENIKVIAETIKKRPDIPIRIEGHSDAKPLRWTIFDKFSNNMELSIDRGATVAGILIKAGVDAQQISIIGIGPVRPVSSNESPEGRAKNRRVEIKMMDTHNDFS
jgi:outer membrane protein OmpA-like peptidoglycan-associated protein